MTGLRLLPNIGCVDDVYGALVQAHRGLDPDGSARLNFRLILLLLNHVGDEEVALEAIRLASGLSRKRKGTP